MYANLAIFLIFALLLLGLSINTTAASDEFEYEFESNPRREADSSTTGPFSANDGDVRSSEFPRPRAVFIWADDPHG